jgi:hypothetical protein
MTKPRLTQAVTKPRLPRLTQAVAEPRQAVTKVRLCFVCHKPLRKDSTCPNGHRHDEVLGKVMIDMGLRNIH